MSSVDPDVLGTEPAAGPSGAGVPARGQAGERVGVGS